MKLNAFIHRYRLWLIIVPIVVTVFMLLPLTKGRINSNLMEYLPDDIEAKVEHERLEKIFGKFEPILIILKADDVLAESTLERVKNINDALKESVLVDDVISLFETKYIRGEEGAMLVDPAVDEIPYTDEDREQLREQLVGNPIAYGIVVSEDFRYTTIIVNAAEEVSDEDIIEEIEKIINLNPGPESVYLNGLPYLRYEVQRKATRDLAILFPLGLLIMLLFLYISFREFRGVLLPFSGTHVHCVGHGAYAPAWLGFQPAGSAGTHNDDCHCQQLWGAHRGTLPGTQCQTAAVVHEGNH